MPLELEVLDQLEGGDLPLDVVVGLFEDEAHAGRSIAAMLASGDLQLIDADGSVVAPWRLRELQAQTRSWLKDTAYRLTLTDAGARRIRGPNGAV